MKYDVAGAIRKLESHGWQFVVDNGVVAFRAIRKGILYLPQDLKAELDAHKKEVKEWVLTEHARKQRPSGGCYRMTQSRVIASRNDDEPPDFGDPDDDYDPFQDERVLHWIANPPAINYWTWNKNESIVTLPVGD